MLCCSPRVESPKSQNARLDPNAPVEVVLPEHGAYTGAFMDFGDAEDEVTLEIDRGIREHGRQTSGDHRLLELLG